MPANHTEVISPSTFLTTGDRLVTIFCSGTPEGDAAPLPANSYAFVRLLPRGSVPVYRATIGRPSGESSTSEIPSIERLENGAWVSVPHLRLNKLQRYAVAWIAQADWDGELATLERTLDERYATKLSPFDLNEGRLVIERLLGADGG